MIRDLQARFIFTKSPLLVIETLLRASGFPRFGSVNCQRLVLDNLHQLDHHPVQHEKRAESGLVLPQICNERANWKTASLLRHSLCTYTTYFQARAARELSLLP